MSVEMKPKSSIVSKNSTEKRRAPWRQRLIDAERGMTSGLRSDSSFFVHFFTSSIVIAAAVVFGFELLQWAILTLAITVVLAAEMFNQVLKALSENGNAQKANSVQKALRISTAAVFVTLTGSVVTIGLLFGQRLFAIFGE